MAIKFDAGRAAAAAAIKQQAIFLGMGSGDPAWATSHEFNGSLSNGSVFVGKTGVSNVVVKNAAGSSAFLADIDYTVNEQTGVITRASNGGLSINNAIKVLFVWDTPEPDVSQTALLAPLAYRKVDEVAFVVPDDVTGDIQLPSGRYARSTPATRYLYVRCRLAYEDLVGETIRELALFVNASVSPSLPVGQMLFTPAQMTDAGKILAGQNMASMPRASGYKTEYEFVIPF